jgi:hypothetical protein
MAKLLLIFSVCLYLICLGWFYSHPYFVNDPFQSRMWHLWDKTLVALLFASHLDKKNIYLRLSVIGVVVFCLIRIIWQVFELENEVQANTPKMIFILYIVDVLVIAWIIHIQFIVNTFRKWRKRK